MAFGLPDRGFRRRCGEKSRQKPWGTCFRRFHFNDTGSNLSVTSVPFSSPSSPARHLPAPREHLFYPHFCGPEQGDLDNQVRSSGTGKQKETGVLIILLCEDVLMSWSCLSGEYSRSNLNIEAVFYLETISQAGFPTS